MAEAGSTEKLKSIEQLENELQSRHLQLHWILQISKAINFDYPTGQLLGTYEFILQEQLHIKRLVLFMLDDEWHCPSKFGVESIFNNEDVEKEVTRLIEAQDAVNNAPAWRKDFDTIIPVYHKEKTLAYALIGGISQLEANAKKELITFVQTITNIIVVAIENKRLAREQIKQAGIKKELELAAQMQSMLFPSSLPDCADYQINATYLPHQEVGGDYYDYIKLNDEEFIICMADVSGKGIAAAILMSNFQANLHAFIKHNRNLEELIVELNSNVFVSAKGEKFITFFLARINHKKREMFYINAGHNPPFLLYDGKIKSLKQGTTGLGMFEELPFLNHAIVDLPAKSLLLCYTDGVVDLENPENKFYGTDRLKRYMRQHTDIISMDHFHSGIINELIEFKKENPYNDDVTLLSVRFKN
jgi:phosphoserine phosphatase RsbU/P